MTYAGKKYLSEQFLTFILRSHQEAADLTLKPSGTDSRARSLEDTEYNESLSQVKTIYLHVVSASPTWVKIPVLFMTPSRFGSSLTTMALSCIVRLKDPSTVGAPGYRPVNLGKCSLLLCVMDAFFSPVWVQIQIHWGHSWSPSLQ